MKNQGLEISLPVPYNGEILGSIYETNYRIPSYDYAVYKGVSFLRLRKGGKNGI